MKRLLFGFIVLSTIFAIMTQPAPAAPKSTPVAWNKTTDAWAWITAYSSGYIQGAWCVPPGKTDATHSFNLRITDLRVEVTHKNCAHPVMLDRTIGPRRGSIQINGLLEGKDGKYTWRNF